MITTILASLVLGQAGWGATAVAPEAVAKRVDDKLATLTKATTLFQYFYVRSDSHPEGGRAAAACLGNIVAPGVFWLQVPSLNFKKRHPLNYEIWIADGKRFSGVVDPANPDPVPIAKRPPGPAHPASVWFKDFSKIILSGLGRPTKPLQGFVADARRQGFKVISQGRKFPYKRSFQEDFRIVAFKGNVRYEVVVNARGNVPTSVTNTIGTKDVSGWRAVDWNLRPGKTLNVGAVNFRKKGPSASLSPKPPRR